MELEVGQLYLNASGDIIEIMGSETLLESVFYDRNGIAYQPCGFPWNGDSTLRLVSIVQ